METQKRVLNLSKIQLTFLSLFQRLSFIWNIKLFYHRFGRGRVATRIESHSQKYEGAAPINATTGTAGMRDRAVIRDAIIPTVPFNA